MAASQRAALPDQLPASAPMPDRYCFTLNFGHGSGGSLHSHYVPLADSCGAAKRPSQIGSISIALLELASARSHDLTLLTKQRESLASYIDRERLRDRGSRT